MSQKKNKKSSDQSILVLKKHLMQAVFACMNAFAALMLIALMTHHLPQTSIWTNATGLVGQQIAQTLYAIFGYMAFGLPLGITVLAIHILYDHQRLFDMHWALLLVRCLGLMLFIAAGSGLMTIVIDPPVAGGALGLQLLTWFWRSFQGAGSLIILLSALSLGLTWSLGVSWDIQICE
jgi:hypothetical protein